MDQDENFSNEEFEQEEGYSFPQFGVNQVGQFVKGFKDGLTADRKEPLENKDKDSKAPQPVNNNNNGLTSANTTNNNPDINKSPLNNKEKNSPLNNNQKSLLDNKEKSSALNKTDSSSSMLNDDKSKKKDDKKEDDDSKKDDNKDDKDKSKNDKDDKEKKGGIEVGLKSKVSAFKAFILKYKVPIILGLGILFLLFLLLFAFIMPAIVISETGITGNTVSEFICEMGEISTSSPSVTSGYGWRIKTFGGSYWSSHKITATPLCRGDCTDDCSNASSDASEEEEEENVCTIYAYEGTTYTEDIYTGEFTNTNIYYYDLRSGEMKVANFNYGIDLDLSSGKAVYALQPGKFLQEKQLGSKGIGTYTVIDHSEAGEANIKSIYGNLSVKPSSLDFIVNEVDPEDNNSRIVMEDVIGQTGNKNLYLEIQDNDIGISLNRYFGYDDPIEICSNYSSSPSIKEIESKCGLPSYIGETEGRTQICNEGLYGISSGEYTSLVCGTDEINARKPTRAQCAAGVYQYFESFLPSLDNEAWKKYSTKVKGNAIDYWTNNNKLGQDGFKTSRTPKPGSVWVSSHSNELCGGKACGHVMVVEEVNGENVTVFECNYDGQSSCRTYTTTSSALASKPGFLGYIHILGDCTNEKEED